MGSIFIGFQVLLHCPLFWAVMVFGVILGVLEVLYADKCGYGAYCKVTFAYRMPNAPKTAERLSNTMHLLAIAAVIMPLFMQVFNDCSGAFVLLWWAFFLGVSIVTQWVLMFVLILKIMYSRHGS
ncbi:MAG: hypothetical protein J6N49_00440 [Alphaproteobacteria bacterium]|nr:hypothetical protein [Alphaproteobacteria bacterium]